MNTPTYVDSIPEGAEELGHGMVDLPTAPTERTFLTEKLKTFEGKRTRDVRKEIAHKQDIDSVPSGPMTAIFMHERLGDFVLHLVSYSVAKGN